jgi:hypothetical protein
MCKYFFVCKNKMITVAISMILNLLRQDDNKEHCKELKKNLKKFSENNNIHRSLLYEYNLFCKDKF